MLNYPVKYNEGRTKDPRGYVEDDIPLLLELGILKRVGGKHTMNPKLKITPAEIATFLNWVANNKRGAMPIALKKILCLKRAAIVNSALSSGTSAGLRTAHAGRLREIDDLLAAGGFEPCDGRVAPSAPPSTLTAPTVFTAPMSIAPPSVAPSMAGDSEVSTASLASTIQSIQESLRRIEGVPAAAGSTEFRDLKKLILETLIPKAINTNETLHKQFEKINEILAAIKALPASPEKVAAEKAAAAVAGAAAADASPEAIMRGLAELQAAVAKCCSGESLNKIKAMIDGAIDGLRGEFGGSLDDIKTRLEEIKGFVPRADVADKINAVLAQLAAPAGDTTTIRDKLSEIQETLARSSTSADVIRRLDEVASDLSGAIVGEVRRSRDSIAGQLNMVNTALQTIIARIDEMRPEVLLNNLNGLINYIVDGFRGITDSMLKSFSTLQTATDKGFSDTRGNIASLRTEVADMHRECAQSSALVNSQIESLNASIAALRALIETQRPPADYLEPVLTAIAQQRAALAAQIAALGEGDAELRRTLEARQAEVARLQAEVARLTAAGAEKDGSLAAQAASIAERVAEIARIQAELETQRASGATDATRIAELEASLAAKKKDCDEAVNQARRELGAKNSQERSRLDAELRQLRTLRDSWTAEKLSAGERNATQKAEIARLTSQIDSDMKKLEEFRTNLAVLQSAKAAEIATIQANLEAARRNSESRRTEYVSALAALQAERDRIREEAGIHNTEFTAEIEALRNQNAELRAQITEAQSAAEGARETAQSEVAATVAELRTQIATLQHELREIKEGDGTGAGGNSLVSLRGKIAAAEAKAARATAEITELQTRLRAAEELNRSFTPIKEKLIATPSGTLIQDKHQVYMVKDISGNWLEVFGKTPPFRGLGHSPSTISRFATDRNGSIKIIAGTETIKGSNGHFYNLTRRAKPAADAGVRARKIARRTRKARAA